MKTLTLLRHAKSGYDDPLLRDFDRPLNDRGSSLNVLTALSRRKRNTQMHRRARASLVR